MISRFTRTPIPMNVASSASVWPSESADTNIAPSAYRNGRHATAATSGTETGFERPTTNRSLEGCTMDVRRCRVVRSTRSRYVRGRRRGFVRVRHAAGAVLVLAGVAGCSLPAPSGQSPLRYRDVIFPNLTVTSGLTYGSAP